MRTKPTKEECEKEMEGYINTPEDRKKYRVAYCSEAFEYVVQVKDGGDRWLCLHNDRKEENNSRQVTFTWSTTVNVRSDFNPCNEEHVAEARREAWMNIFEKNGEMEGD